MFGKGDYVHVFTNNFRGTGVTVWGLGRVQSVSACGEGVFIQLEYCSKQAWVGVRIDFDANDCEIVCPTCSYKYCECDDRPLALPDDRYLNDLYNQALDS